MQANNKKANKNPYLKRVLASKFIVTLLSVCTLTYFPGVVAAKQPTATEVNRYIQQLQNPQQQPQAVESLIEIGRPAVPQLIQLLQTRAGLMEMLNPYESKSSSAVAIETLIKIGKPAVPELIGALTHNKTYTVFGATETLGQIIETDPSILDLVIPRLWDNHPKVRLGVTLIISQDSKFKPKVESAIANALNHQDAKVRNLAAFYQGLIDQESSSTAIPVVKARLQDPDEVKRLSAALSLLNKNLETTPATQVLIQALRSPDSMIRLTAIIYGVEIHSSLPKSEAKQFLSSIIKSIEDEDSGVRETAILSLVNEGEKAKSAIPSLIKVLDDSDKNIRGLAVYTLGDMGKYAKAAIPKIISILEDREDNVINRSNAAMALADIGTDADLTIPVLINTLTEPKNHKHIRMSAALSLKKIDVKSLVPPLVNLLSDREIGVSSASMLVSIATEFQDNKYKLSASELDRSISKFEQALSIIERSDLDFDREKVKSFRQAVEVLKQQTLSRSQ